MEDIESSDSNDELCRKEGNDEKYDRKDRSPRANGKRLSGDVPRAYRISRRRLLTVDERMAKNRRRRLQRLRFVFKFLVQKLCIFTLITLGYVIYKILHFTYLENDEFFRSHVQNELA